MASESYVRCPCGRFVEYKNYDAHVKSKHLEFIAVEQPPAPSQMANPPPGDPNWNLPPRRPEPKTPGGIVIDILLMRRDYPKAFLVYTAIVFGLSSLFISNLMLWILFHVP